MRAIRLALCSSVVVGCLALAQSANASPLVSWHFANSGADLTAAQNSFAAVPSIYFDTFDAVSLLGSPFGGPGVTGTVATYTGTATVQTGSNSSGATPWGDSSQYVTINSGQTLTIAFNAPQTSTFGFYWGSTDLYNTPITVFGVDSSNVAFSESFTPPAPGAGNPSDGNQHDGSMNGYLTFTALLGSKVTSLVLGDQTSPAFEIDNVFASQVSTANPTPLPGALPLFVSGIGAFGLLGWRRKRKQLRA